MEIKLHNLTITIDGKRVSTMSASGGVGYEPEDVGEYVSDQIKQWSAVREFRAKLGDLWYIEIIEDDDADRSWMDHSGGEFGDCRDDHSNDPLYLISLFDLEGEFVDSLGGVHMGPNGIETGRFAIEDIDGEGDYIAGIIDDMVSEFLTRELVP